MQKVNNTELRNHLPDYLAKAGSGQTLVITSRGRIVARLSPPEDVKVAARKRLKQLQSICEIGDITSPIDEKWDAADDCA